MKKYYAEFIGTFSLVFAVIGAIIVNDLTSGTITHAGIAMTAGLVVMVMIYAVGDVSGAHFNPAVTFGFWAARRLPASQVIPYVASQTAGAFVASFTLRLLFPEQTTLGVTLPSGSWSQSFILEIILTFFLVFVILNVATGSKEKGLLAGVAIGATVGLDAMFGGPISGASMNPARSLAPAVVSGNLHFLWIYLIAPFLGSLLAVAGYRGVKNAHDK